MKGQQAPVTRRHASEPLDRMRAARAAGEIAAALARGAPLAIKLTKASINKALMIDLPTMLEHEARAQCILMVTEDCKEAMAAFMEKRQPVFKGK